MESILSNYGKLCTIIYDLDKPLADENEVSLYTQFILSNNDPIIEPMCGSGRFYIPIRKRGYNIYGFDLSNEMLKSCERRCSELNIIPNLFNANIVHYKSDMKFKYAFIPMGSISLLINENDLIQSFANIFEYLDNDSIFMFSALRPTPEIEDIPDWKEIMRYPLKGMEIICNQSLVYNKLDEILDIKLQYEIIDKNVIIEKEDQDFPLKMYAFDYLQEKLDKIGFKQIIELKNNNHNKFILIKCNKSK
ncbi:MAG: class I SAM-dependent methyltransferase [Bacteroidales bacterium]|nr:class I SAM-dependent methyltransferase [Bacteroidales bacterium]